jgi:hypothetical protein
MTVFNEIAASVYLYFLIILTDFHGRTDKREECGWSLMILATFVVFINLSKVII